MKNENPESLTQTNKLQAEGILLVNKPSGLTSFSLVRTLRKRLGIKKIGHSGTLDPFATGLMVMLIGRNYTKLSNSFLTQGKEYIAHVFFGASTDTYDCDGHVVSTSEKIPSLEELKKTLNFFQGSIEQIPPMYSAKKQQGKKLYELARKGIEVTREPIVVTLETELIDYAYPLATLRIACSKGTYIRSIAQDLGSRLGCGAHLKALQRVRSGDFLLKDSIDGNLLLSPELDLAAFLQKVH